MTYDLNIEQLLPRYERETRPYPESRGIRERRDGCKGLVSTYHWSVRVSERHECNPALSVSDDHPVIKFQNGGDGIAVKINSHWCGVYVLISCCPGCENATIACPVKVGFIGFGYFLISHFVRHHVLSPVCLRPYCCPGPSFPHSRNLPCSPVSFFTYQKEGVMTLE